MNVKILCIDEGHTLSGSDYGAKGNGLFESIETRALGKLVEKYAKELGTQVDKCTVDYANSVAESITKRVALANSRAHELLLIIHFNAFGSDTASGCEAFILPYSNAYSSRASFEKNLAYGEAILNAVCNTGGFTKRGGAVKFRDDLGMLGSTKDHSVYLEVCFLTNKSDSDKYKANKDRIARAIAETIIGKKLSSNTTTTTQNTTNTNIKEEVKVDYIIQYSNSVDQAIAEVMADRLNCPTINCLRPYGYYAQYKNVIAVGEAKNKSGYTNVVIAGKDRKETADLAIAYCKKIGR